MVFFQDPPQSFCLSHESKSKCGHDDSVYCSIYNRLSEKKSIPISGLILYWLLRVRWNKKITHLISFLYLCLKYPEILHLVPKV